MRKLSRLVVALAAISLLQACAAASPVAFGPYIQNVSQTEATVCWITVEGEATVQAEGQDKLTGQAYREHEIRFTGLKPGTTYSYDVTPDGVPGGTGAFTTAPASPDASFTFVAYGDSRSRHDIHAKILAAVSKASPAFVVNTGDMVSDGRRLSDWKPFFEVTQGLMRTVPYYPVLGNHESDSPYYFEFFALPGNERYYSFDYGPVHCIVLDSAGPRVAAGRQVQQTLLEEYWKDQLLWLREDLESHAAAPYIFLFFHNPLYSAKASRYEESLLFRRRLEGIFKANRVSAVFNGHDHFYAHSLAGGVQYVVTGGGGAPLYDPDKPIPETVKAVKIEHWVKVAVTPQQATVTAIDIDGNTIEEFTIAPRPK